VVDVAESYTALTRFHEIHLDYCHLALLADSNVDMCEVMIDSQL
jgi:hypothetical protein